MYTVYALYSKDHNKIYIGYTSDLDARLQSHNVLATKGWTKRFRPWKVVYSEAHQSKLEAMRREKQLKSAQGRKFVWDIINKD